MKDASEANFIPHLSVLKVIILPLGSRSSTLSAPNERKWWHFEFLTPVVLTGRLGSCSSIFLLLHPITPSSVEVTLWFPLWGDVGRAEQEGADFSFTYMAEADVTQSENSPQWGRGFPPLSNIDKVGWGGTKWG